jgi:hypothetical protein
MPFWRKELLSVPSKFDLGNPPTDFNFPLFTVIGLNPVRLLCLISIVLWLYICPFKPVCSDLGSRSDLVGEDKIPGAFSTLGSLSSRSDPLSPSAYFRSREALFGLVT